ncbi:MAG: nucleotidyltransferase family protein [Acidimicrobiales bacterium]
MASEIAGVALAAGAGTRLSPITDVIAKPLCEVATIPLLDLAVARLGTVGAEVAVNAHHHHEDLQAHLGTSVHISHEVDEALGTAGAIGRLREWIDGRATVIVNADTWCPGPLDALLEGWDNERVRVMVPGGGTFGPSSAVVGTLLPWRVVRELADTPSGLFEMVWRSEQQDGLLEVVDHAGVWVDCGTPAELHRANMFALAGRSVVHPDARVSGLVQQTAVSAGVSVAGEANESVLLRGSLVAAGESVSRVIRWRSTTGQQTIQL